jgi:hypothetical protein
MRQGAFLSFAGDLADPAQEAFAKFLSRPHDHKAAQLGDFVYTNGSVRLYCLPDEPQITYRGRTGLVWIIAFLRWARALEWTL